MMEISHDNENIKLSSGEISELFNVYLSNSASICVLSYLVETAQDPDIKSITNKLLDLSRSIVGQITKIFESVKHPTPIGFSAEDVNVNATSLFSDKFILIFAKYMLRFALVNYSESRSSCSRSDVRAFFNKTIQSTLELLEMADNMLLNKGLYIKEPSVPIPSKIDFVQKQSFMKGFFGEIRPINVGEIDRLYFNYNRNTLGKAFLIGLCQTTKSTEIKEYFMRGKNISEKHTDSISTILQKDELPIPESLDSEVTDSTVTVFSDKLMIYFVVTLNAMGIATNGLSLSRVMRRDISLALARFITEIALYAEDGVNIMIDNGWLERIPQAADRKELFGL